MSKLLKIHHIPLVVFRVVSNSLSMTEQVWALGKEVVGQLPWSSELGMCWVAPRISPISRLKIGYFAFFNETIHPPFFLNSRDLKKRFVIESPNSMK